jgi:hypothetical protein
MWRLRRIALKSKIRSNICLEEFPLQFGRGRAMVLAVIFGVGKINRSSNKEGSGYRGKPPMKFRHLEYFVAAAECFRRMYLFKSFVDMIRKVQAFGL